MDATGITLSNRYLIAEIDSATAVLKAVTNRLTGRRHVVAGDRFGVTVRTDAGGREEFVAGAPGAPIAGLSVRNDAAEAAVAGTICLQHQTISVTYRLRPDRFWLERRIAFGSRASATGLDRVVYGRLDVPGASVRTLELGSFDRARVATEGNGGLFAGVGWWFSSVAGDGVYHNEKTGFDVNPGKTFESEPWYVGVFGTEPGEPWPGWLWYRQFLQMRKDEHDRQSWWCYWNAGWGQWGIDIDDPAAPPYIDLAKRLGVRGICFGGGAAGKGIPAYIDLARSSETARRNLALCRDAKIEAGFLHSPVKWDDAAAVDGAVSRLDAFAKAGYGAFHFDFFQSADTFAAHRRVAEYFRTARERLAYTECHLGMAAYGPQFQREVLLNHPDDLHEHGITPFSADWATFLGFRHSRRAWQAKYDGVMPDCGLYYFLTHYSNWGHARAYADPEPQQFLYGPHAYCGVAYNLHDPFGYRDVLAAASAFTPYYVFGHLDLKMPERDIAFTRAWLDWVAANADVLRGARVCLEDGNLGIVSKIRNGKGALFVLNYSAGGRTARISIEADGGAAFRVRPVYPARREPFDVPSGAGFDVRVPGESVAIFDINGGLASLPPESGRTAPVDVAGWTREGATWKGTFAMPDLRAALTAARDASVPREFTSFEQIGDRPGETPDPVVKWIGRGRLPEPFVRAMGFRDGRVVDAWKAAPWAFADRVWLVWKPDAPPKLADALPSVRLNGKPVPLVPRIDYRPGDVKSWTCPLAFGDVTNLCAYGEPNELRLEGLPETGTWYVTSAADRR